MSSELEVVVATLPPLPIIKWRNDLTVQEKRLYRRQLYRARKQRDPEAFKASNRARYQKLKADPEKYQAYLALRRANHVPSTRVLKTDEEKIISRNASRRKYWATHPKQYKVHLDRCREYSRRMRRDRFRDAVAGEAVARLSPHLPEPDEPEYTESEDTESEDETSD
jgi:hypothetical protein